MDTLSGSVRLSLTKTPPYWPVEGRGQPVSFVWGCPRGHGPHTEGTGSGTGSICSNGQDITATLGFHHFPLEVLLSASSGSQISHVVFLCQWAWFFGLRFAPAVIPWLFLSRQTNYHSCIPPWHHLITGELSPQFGCQ